MAYTDEQKTVLRDLIRAIKETDNLINKCKSAFEIASKNLETAEKELAEYLQQKSELAKSDCVSIEAWRYLDEMISISKFEMANMRGIASFEKSKWIQLEGSKAIYTNNYNLFKEGLDHVPDNVTPIRKT